MSAWDNDSSDDLKRELRAVFKEEPIGEDLAREVREDARDEELSPELEAVARRALAQGLFDGGVSRARSSMTGGLTTFETSIRRIRNAAQHSPEEMASRAGVTVRLWTDIETKRVALQAVEIMDLASIAEAVQLDFRDIRATIRRSLRVGAVGPHGASFRADDPDDADSAAAYESLLEHVAARTGHVEDGEGGDAADELARRVVKELRRRGRTDLLEPSK